MNALAMKRNAIAALEQYVECCLFVILFTFQAFHLKMNGSYVGESFLLLKYWCEEWHDCIANEDHCGDIDVFGMMMETALESGRLMEYIDQAVLLLEEGGADEGKTFNLLS